MSGTICGFFKELNELKTPNNQDIIQSMFDLSSDKHQMVLVYAKAIAGFVAEINSNLRHINRILRELQRLKFPYTLKLSYIFEKKDKHEKIMKFEAKKFPDIIEFESKTPSSNMLEVQFTIKTNPALPIYFKYQLFCICVQKIASENSVNGTVSVPASSLLNAALKRTSRVSVPSVIHFRPLEQLLKKYKFEYHKDPAGGYAYIVPGIL